MTINDKIEEVLGSRLGPLEWSADGKFAYCKCPGEHLHTSPSGKKHTRVFADEFPNFDCRHDSCKKVCDEHGEALRTVLGDVGLFERKPLTAEQRQEWEKRTAAQKQSRRYAQNLQWVLEEYEWPVSAIRSASAEITDPHAQFLDLWPAETLVWCGEPWHSGKLIYSSHLKTPAEWKALKAPQHPFTCGASFKPGAYSRSLESMDRPVFTIIECDGLHKDPKTNMDLSGSVLRFVRETIGWKLRCVVSSGNKSIHGWFDYPGDEEHAKALVSFDGLGVDLKTLRPTQPVRSPGFSREGRDQELLWIG